MMGKNTRVYGCFVFMRSREVEEMRCFGLTFVNERRLFSDKPLEKQIYDHSLN
jgi:hypothetical protein